MIERPSIEKRGQMTPERRQARRYPVAAPVLFRWREAGGAERQKGGFTLNVSTKGTYITCDGNCPPISSRVTVELLLPLQQEKNRLTLKADGQVVRITTGDDGKGFAVSTNFSSGDDNAIA